MNLFLYFINENKDLLDLIANTLLEYETITKEQIEYLVKNGCMPDEDGEVDARDASRVLSASIGQFNIEKEYIKNAADITKDGVFDARDASRILSFSIGQFNINL